MEKAGTLALTSEHIILKRITELNVQRPQSIQLLEENRQIIRDLGRDKYFLERVQKT